MAIRMIINGKVLTVTMFVALSVFLGTSGIDAKIPEPDNILYGMTAAGTVTVSLKINGIQIASYTMGENPNAGDFYVLRIPMDALDPAEPGTAREGDVGYIYVNDDTTATASTAMGGMGSIQRIDLSAEDTDQDGLPDDWEQQIIDADPNDNITSLDDVLPDDDFDGDGENNATEHANATDPADHLSTMIGDLDGDKYITIADTIIALQVLSNSDTGSGQYLPDGDINDDGTIGFPEALNSLEKVSGRR